MNASLDSGRLNRLRTARAITQADLADRVGLSPSVLNRVENGRHSIGQDDVRKLADALDCDPALLSRPLPDFLYTRPWLRAYADAPKKTVDEYVADTLLAMEFVDVLGLKRIRDRMPLFDNDLQDEHAIDDFAHDVRLAADVGPEEKVGNVTRAAERLGCVVLPLDSELGKHLGMSMHVNGVAVLRVSRPSDDGGVPGDRQRFTLAHELGHVALHATCPPPETAEQAKAIEKQAHRFAGAFLLPGDPFLEDLEALGGRVTLSTLSKLKARWGVAIKAMVVRLQNLNRIDAHQARSLYKQISARDWNKNEPVHVGNERAVWLRQALGHRFPESEDVVSAAVERSGLGPTYFDSWIAWEPPERRDAQIIRFPVSRTLMGRG